MSTKGFVGGNRATSLPTTIAPVVQQNALEEATNRNKMRLGLWDRMNFNRETSVIMRDKLGEIATAMLEKQKQEIVHGLMLDLDEAKKRQFGEYLKKVGKVNEDLVRDSNKMEIALNRAMFEEISKAYELKGDWDRRLKELKESGLTTESEYQAEVSRMEKWAAITRDNIEGKIEIVIRGHIKTLEVTLELLRDKALKGSEQL